MLGTRGRSRKHGTPRREKESLDRSRQSEEFPDEGSKYSGTSAKCEEEEVPP